MEDNASPGTKSLRKNIEIIEQGARREEILCKKFGSGMNAVGRAKTDVPSELNVRKTHGCHREHLTTDEGTRPPPARRKETLGSIGGSHSKERSLQRGERVNLAGIAEASVASLGGGVRGKYAENGQHTGGEWVECWK